MNKKILYLFVILLSFCIYSNVNAQSYEFETDLFGTVTVDIDELISGKDLTGNFILSKNSTENNLVLIFESSNYTLNFTNGRFTNLSSSNKYVATYSSIYDSSTGTWSTPTTTTYGITTKYTNIYYTNIKTIPVWYNNSEQTSINMKFDNDTGIYFEETDESRGELMCVGTTGSAYLAYKNETTKLIEFYYNLEKTNSFSYEEYPYYFIDSSGINYCQFNYSAEEFYYNTTTGYNTAKTTSYWIRPQTNSTTNNSSQISQNSIIYSNFDFYTETGDLYFKNNLDKAPTIEINEENRTSVTILGKEYVTDVTLNIKFSSINNDKYLYQYKFIGAEESLWTTKTMENDNFSLKFSENGTLIVRVVDKSTNEVVTSSTYTIASINYDLTPYITIDEYVGDNCTAGDYTLCKTLRINSHIADFNKYSFYVFDDTAGTSAKYDEQTIYYYVYENKTIHVRIVENSSGKIIDEKNYTVATIPEEVSGLGQYITKNCQFYNAETSYFCNYIIYNYDNDLYDYYYRTSTTLYELIPNSLPDIVPTGTGAVIYKKEYSSNETAYIKIVEKETNTIVLEKSFNITFDKDLEKWLESGDFGVIGNFINEHILKKLGFVGQIKEIITNFFLFDFVEDAKPPVFKFDLSFIGLQTVEAEMKIDDSTRLKIHSLIKTFASLGVLFTFVKQLSSFIGHQKE